MMVILSLLKSETRILYVPNLALAVTLYSQIAFYHEPSAGNIEFGHFAVTPAPNITFMLPKDGGPETPSVIEYLLGKVPLPPHQNFGLNVVRVQEGDVVELRIDNLDYKEVCFKTVWVGGPATVCYCVRYSCHVCGPGWVGGCRACVWVTGGCAVCVSASCALARGVCVYVQCMCHVCVCMCQCVSLCVCVRQVPMTCVHTATAAAAADDVYSSTRAWLARSVSYTHNYS